VNKLFIIYDACYNHTMPQQQPSAVENSTRARILDAAELRFQAYGYGKTTMTEIAEDVGMSAANLYRYFHNKLDIGVACSNRCLQGRIDRLRQAARSGGHGAGQRLERFFLEDLNVTHEIVSERPHINEMVELITTRKPELIKARIRDIVSLLAEILAYGNERGEFDVDDVVASAATVHAALVLFELPIFVGLYSHAEYSGQARALARLLVQGLSRR